MEIVSVERSSYGGSLDIFLFQQEARGQGGWSRSDPRSRNTVTPVHCRNQERAWGPMYFSDPPSDANHSDKDNPAGVTTSEKSDPDRFSVAQ
jgi:hypothetical protein